MRLRPVPATALGVALICLLPASVASAAKPVTVRCGQTITEDTRLANDLTNCRGDGLVIAAARVELDLNGHTVDGDGAGADVGINVNGQPGVIVERGTVREFAEGVLVVASRDSKLRGLVTADNLHGGISVLGSRQVRVERNSARSNAAGIIVQRSAAVLVARNSVADSEASGIPLFEAERVQVVDNVVTTSRTSAGIGVFDGSTQNSVARNRLSSNAAGIGLNSGASQNVIEANSLSRNESGVILDVGTRDNDVVRNRIEDSGFEGIAVVGSDENLLANNRLARNGALADAGGVAVIPLPDDPSETSDGNSLLDNVVGENAGDGIYVGSGQSGTLIQGNRSDRNTDDGLDVDSTASTVSRNVANRNGDLGIEAVAGVVDGGGNKASGNGNPLQCTTVFCKGN